MKVLVVCHGNINRSPLCAAVLSNHKKLEVRQAAMKSLVAGWRPERAAKKMRDAAYDEFGIDLEQHRSQPFTDSLFEWADTIIYMDGGNLRRIEEFFDVCSKKTPCLRLPKLICLGECLGLKKIADPAFMRRDSAEFRSVVRTIYRASHYLGEKLSDESNRN